MDQRKYIVSRHPGAILWLQSQLKDFNDRRVVTTITKAEAMGADIVGNLPMALASRCLRYRAIEFEGPPPRGAEYGAAEMAACGASLAEYVVMDSIEAESLYQGYCYAANGAVAVRWETERDRRFSFCGTTFGEENPGS